MPHLLYRKHTVFFNFMAIGTVSLYVGKILFKMMNFSLSKFCDAIIKFLIFTKICQGIGFVLL